MVSSWANILPNKYMSMFLKFLCTFAQYSMKTFVKFPNLTLLKSCFQYSKLERNQLFGTKNTINCKPILPRDFYSLQNCVISSVRFVKSAGKNIVHFSFVSDLCQKHMLLQ